MDRAGEEGSSEGKETDCGIKMQIPVLKELTHKRNKGPERLQWSRKKKTRPMFISQ